MVASYVADISEAEDTLSVKQGNFLFIRCHVCEVQSADLAGSFDAPKRCWKIIEADLPSTAHMNGVTKDHMELLAKKAVVPVVPIPVTFHFVGIHPSVVVYPNFRIEPLHNLSLGVDQFLKEYIWNMLSDLRRETRVSKKRSGSNKTFKSLTVIILSELIMFLMDFQKELVGTGLRKVFKKPGQPNRFTGLFTNTSLTSMLERADFNSVDMVFPFLGAIEDKCCV